MTGIASIVSKGSGSGSGVDGARGVNQRVNLDQSTYREACHTGKPAHGGTLVSEGLLVHGDKLRMRYTSSAWRNIARWSKRRRAMVTRSL